MNKRFVRALERGGMASQIRVDRWGIWRGRDRRTRKIGEVSGTDIDLLRLDGSLCPLAAQGVPTLIWSGPRSDTGAARPSAESLKASDPPVGGPLIELVIKRASDPELRALIRDTAIKYRQDVALAENCGRTPGMNWTSLALGGRIQGGPYRVRETMSDESRRARRRLAAISLALSAEDCDCLDRLLLSGQSRAAMARRFGIRPSLMEPRAVSLLRQLADLYARGVGA